MLCSWAWGEQLTLLWEFCGTPEKWWTTNLRSYLFPATWCCETCSSALRCQYRSAWSSTVASLSQELSSWRKHNGQKPLEQTHQCTAAVLNCPTCPLLVPVGRATSSFIWKVSQIPKKLPKTAPLRVWSTEQRWPNHRNINFHTPDKAAPKCSGRESAWRSLHLLGHDLHHPHSPCVSCQTSIPTAGPSTCTCSDHLTCDRNGSTPPNHTFNTQAVWSDHST